MPTPDQRPPSSMTNRDWSTRHRAIHDQMAAAFTGSPRATLDDVLSAVTVLTEEVRRLSVAIEPPASALIVGPDALREFQRIKAGR